MNTRPVSVTIIGLVFIAAGAIGLIYHLTEFRAQPFPYDLLWISFVRLIAIISGVYMLRGHNWARWLALGWIAFHVILSAFHSVFELALHGVLLAAFAYLLFRVPATRYFRGAEARAGGL